MKFQPEEGLQVEFRLGLSKEENLLILCSKKILIPYFVHYLIIFRMFGGTLVIVRGGKKFMIDESKQKLYQVMQVIIILIQG